MFNTAHTKNAITVTFGKFECLHSKVLVYQVCCTLSILNSKSLHRPISEHKFSTSLAFNCFMSTLCHDNVIVVMHYYNVIVIVIASSKLTKLIYPVLT